MRPRELFLPLALSAALGACEAAPTPQDSLPPAGIVYSSSASSPSPTPERRRAPLSQREMMDMIRMATNIQFKALYSTYPGVIVATEEGIGVLVDKDVLAQLNTRHTGGSSSNLIVPDTTSEVLDYSRFKEFGTAQIYFPRKLFVESLDEKVLPLAISESSPQVGEGLIVVGRGPQEARVKTLSKNEKFKGYSIESLAEANLKIKGAMVIRIEDGIPKVSGLLASTDVSTSKVDGEQVFYQVVTPILEVI